MDANIWSNVHFSVGNNEFDQFLGLSYRYRKKPDGNLEYHNNRGYDNVFKYIAQQKAIQSIEQQVYSLLPKYKKYLDDKDREKILTQQRRNNYNRAHFQDTEERFKQNLGIVCGDNDIEYKATDKYGERVTEALMLYYDLAEAIQVQFGTWENGKWLEEPRTTKTICFIDLIASVTISSSKNLILSPVQGRDFTRKELVSGGDYIFSITGKIVGNERGIYPSNDVKKLIQMTQYGGIIKVNHYLFNQFNVDRILIQDFGFDAPTCKNEQPYHFTCVAVEPAEAVFVTLDSMGSINAQISLASINKKWYQLIADTQWGSKIIDNVSNTAASFAGVGFKDLSPNI
jgi:hypothetical protein